MTITLFRIMDPIGNIPVFLTVLEDVDPSRRKKVLIRELLFALAIIVLFVFFGRFILTWLGLSQESISIAGGIILFLIAIKMVFPTKGNDFKSDEDGEPLLVPLAIPLFAGPSTLAVLILFSSGGIANSLPLLAAAFSAWALSSLILLGSSNLNKLIGRRGLSALGRLMGMILIALSVQMLLDALTAYFS